MSDVRIYPAWPIGSVYLSLVNVNPATLFGCGTWVAFGTGRMLVAVDPNDPDFDTPGKTGGSKATTPAGTVSAPTFTGAQASTSSVSAGTPAGTVAAPTFTGSSANTNAVTAGTPAGSVAAPVFTGSSASTDAVTAGTPAGTNSAPTFTGSALATHQHELPFSKANSATGALSMLAPTGFGTGTSRAVQSISAAPTSNSSSVAMELSQAVSAGTPAGTVSAPVFTGSALSAHQHSLTAAGTNSAPAFTGSALGTHQHAVTASGTNSAPAFTGSALADHAHSLTPAGTVSAPTFAGVSNSVMNPYVAVYMFTRTA